MYFPKTKRIKLVFFVISLVFFIACETEEFTPKTDVNKIDSIISETETIVAKGLKKSDSINVCTVPAEAIYRTNLENPKFVLRKTKEKNIAYFQVVEVEIIKSDNNTEYIVGINNGDELVINPREFLKRIGKADKIEAKNRLLKKQKLSI